MLCFLVITGNKPILCYFRAFWAMAVFGPLGSALEGHGSPLPVNTFMCIHQNLKTISAQIISKKCMQIPHRIVQSYHRCKQNVPESESRQFGRLQLRLLGRGSLPRLRATPTPTLTPHPRYSHMETNGNIMSSYSPFDDCLTIRIIQRSTICPPN